MILCDYCGDDIRPDSPGVNVYDKDVDVSYVTQQDCVPVGFVCATVCVRGDIITYLKEGSLLPSGFEYITVSIKDRDIVYARNQNLIPEGFEHVSVYTRNGEVKYARQGDRPPEGFHQVLTYAKNEEIKYEKESHVTPIGFEHVTVCVKTDGILYTRQGERTPEGFEFASVYVKDGDIALPKCHQVKRVFHTVCLNKHLPRCEGAVRKFLKGASPRSIVLSIGIHVKYVFGEGKAQTGKREKKEKRDRKAFEIVRKVSALRNSYSGYVLVHLVGLAPYDSFTGAFDEFIDLKLQDLIQDEKQFCDVYRKEALNSAFHGFGDFLVLYVGASSIVTTCKFNTKTTLDDSINDIRAKTLSKFVSERKTFQDTFHTLPGVTDSHHLQNVHENRSVQLKSHFLQDVDDKGIAECIIKHYKLAEYISAFTKIENGGSFLYGVHQENRFLEEYGYETKVNHIQPVVLEDSTDFADSLGEIIQNTVLVCSYDGDEIPDANIFQIHLIPCTPVSGKPAVVVHVGVRPLSGIVFYDKQGPLAYRYDEHYKVITRINIKEWIRALT